MAGSPLTFLRSLLRLTVALGCCPAFFPADVAGQADYKRFFDEENVPAVKQLFQAGRYDLCAQVCRMAERRGQPAPDWRVILMKSLAAMGQIDEAVAVAEALPVSFPDDIPTLMEVWSVYDELGRKEAAGKVLALVNEAGLKKKRGDRSGLETVALGRAALAMGADPQEVMANYFDPVKAETPKAKGEIPPGLVEAHAAAGNLALEKSDYKRAAEEFRKALGYEPNDPDLRYGLARAYDPSDRKKTGESLERALDANPVHAPSLLMQAESLINAEEYDAAGERIQRVLSVNKKNPLAWAYRAAIDHLARNDDAEFADDRGRALEIWEKNPAVDHTIGRVLSRNYRFGEGAERQKSALEMDPGYLPAKLQLAHDYLRLGREDEAWKLAEEVARADPYEVLAYNLTILRDEIANFTTLESADFTIRLPEIEAEIYGGRALEILTEARKVLCAKYGLELDHPVLVEFFPHQQDFAIRTFGNLGGGGILGACFGTVVTMNSPGGLAHSRNNWEATLWHEFCHVVTLTVTHNKMPRWLSEGISVYEEAERNPVWGQRMTPEFRKMIVEDKALTPIGELSSAFLNPESGEHLMFAYYHSMLVVKYLVEQFGVEKFQGILKDLGSGVLINDAIARNTEPMEKLEEDFRNYALGLAENLAPGVDWSRPGPGEVDPRDRAAVAAYLAKNPKNLWAHKAHVRNLLAGEKWREAAGAAEELIALYPGDVHGGNGYEMQAAAYKALGEKEKEAAALRKLAERSSEAGAAYNRLLDLDHEDRDWEGVRENADRALAINPFQKRIHYCRGCALEAEQERKGAVSSFEKLLLLKPGNVSEVRFRLARLLKDEDGPRSKRYLLDSLAEAPRYREAQKLLLEIRETDPGQEEKPTPARSAKVEKKK